MKKLRLLAAPISRLVLASLAIATLAVFAILGTAQPANATLIGFDPGNIMDDTIMAKKDAMTESQIQNFLTAKNPCNDSNLSRLSGYNATQGWLHSTLNGQPFTYYYNLQGGKFLCLSNDSFNGKSAARIIWQAAQEYSINPQVLIVLLQKEQALITDTWPNHVQYRTATGFGCPDTAPCDAQYYGLENQVRRAAALFREVLNGGWTNYPVGNNYIRYNPNASCSGTNVYIHNRATSSLYRYTPYQPNSAALAAGWGSAPPCGAYGNRNFYNYFTDWFGSTKVPYEPFITPRWMVITSDVHKKVPTTGQDTVNDDFIIPAGTQLRFLSKITINGQTYYRTAYDHERGLNQGIPASAVGEIQYQPFETPRWMTFKARTDKLHPTSGNYAGQTVEANLNVRFVEKISINGAWYFRSEYDKANNRNFTVPADSLTEAKYENFKDPRIYHVPQTVAKINPVIGTSSSEQFTQNSYVRFTKKITLGSSTYCQAETDANASSRLAVNCTAIKDLVYTKISNGAPYRWVQLSKNAIKTRPATGKADIHTYQKGLQIQVAQSVVVDGKTFYRTKFDVDNHNDLAFSQDQLEELSFTSMERPRNFKTTEALYKINPITGVKDAYHLQAGRQIAFSSKIEIQGIVYLRSAYDTEYTTILAIPASQLVE